MVIDTARDKAIVFVASAGGGIAITRYAVIASAMYKDVQVPREVWMPGAASSGNLLNLPVNIRCTH